jgi:hypothetical protein
MNAIFSQTWPCLFFPINDGYVRKIRAACYFVQIACMIRAEISCHYKQKETFDIIWCHLRVHGRTNKGLPSSLLIFIDNVVVLNCFCCLYSRCCVSNIGHILTNKNRLCGLVVRVPGYTTEMYFVSCEVRTECICYVEESRPPQTQCPGV